MIDWVALLEAKATLEPVLESVDVRLTPVQFVAVNEILTAEKAEGDPRVAEVLDTIQFTFNKKAPS